MSEELLALPKTLPELAWQPHPTHAVTVYAESGVMDAEGRRLRGLQVQFTLRIPTDRRTGESLVLQLDHLELGRGAPRSSIFRMDIRRRPGIPADHHDAPHAHRLGVCMPLPSGAIAWTWDVALAYFCQQTTIVVPDLQHPTENFQLTP